MEGRRIQGEGLEHEQDYVRERLEEGGGVEEYAEDAEILDQERKDLQALEGKLEHAGGSGGETANVLEQTAGLPTGQGELRQGSAMNVDSGVIDPQQLPPDAEARTRVVGQTGSGTGGSEPGR